jgi:hypothetical protein
MTQHSFPDRDWSKVILDLKLKTRLDYHELAKHIGIPYTTLMNLKQSAVLQPLHATGEKILTAYRAEFPNGTCPPTV